MELRKHSFAICAYKESKYLEECILSVKKQEDTSYIYLVTSTPNNFIYEMGKRYDIPVYVNEGEGGITQDWNFAILICKTPYVTITHQDDVYFQNYGEEVVKSFSQATKPLIFFSDYYEIRNQRIEKNNMLLKIKKIMLAPLKIKSFQNSRWIRRRILSLGSPICCPSVAFNLEEISQPIFQNHFRTNEDWEAWENISKQKGQFIYISKPLMAHRIHEESETSRMIREESGRTREDIEMYSKFWPKRLALFWAKRYKKSEEYNG